MLNRVRRNCLSFGVESGVLESRVMLMAATAPATDTSSFSTTNPTFDEITKDFPRVPTYVEDSKGKPVLDKDGKKIGNKVGRDARTVEVNRNKVDDRGTELQVEDDSVLDGIGSRKALSDKDLLYHNPLSGNAKSDKNSSRWIQRKGNTHIFRLLPGDENWRNDRDGAARSEAYTNKITTKESDGKKLTFSARFNVAQHNDNGGKTETVIFQSKGSGSNTERKDKKEPGPAVALKVRADGTIDIVQRSLKKGIKANIVKDVARVGESFDFKILDDGLRYRVYINDEQKAAGYFERGTSKTVPRWGAYNDSGKNGVLKGDPNRAEDATIVYVSGAQASLADGLVKVDGDQFNGPSYVPPKPDPKPKSRRA